MLKSQFLRTFPQGSTRLHFAAHSHHPWPDVTFEAQQQAWLDAARLLDDKWEHLFSTVYPELQRALASELQLPSPDSLVFAPNTHQFVLRILSCLPERPRIVTSDSEFHSFERQLRRLEEDQLVRVERVPSEPFATFPQRLLAATTAQQTDLVFFSQVFFNSGAVVAGLDSLIAALPPEPLVVIDGYHGFLAVPTDLSAIGRRAFYLAGGYKYAMAGEGACFLHVPAQAAGLRPRDTGWYAAFGALAEKVAGRVPYAPQGGAFLGSTFDPSGLYRLLAVLRWRQQLGLTAERTLVHVHALQHRFVEGLGSSAARLGELVVPLSDPRRGQFLTFRTPRALDWSKALKVLHVDTDARDDRLRFGFGVYHDAVDVEALLGRVAQANVPA